jgi:hypothetical protein
VALNEKICLYIIPLLIKYMHKLHSKRGAQSVIHRPLKQFLRSQDFKGAFGKMLDHTVRNGVESEF